MKIKKLEFNQGLTTGDSLLGRQGFSCGPLLGLLLAASTLAQAQESVNQATATPAQEPVSQGTATKRSTSLTPRFSSTVTLTDNVQPGSPIKDGAAIIQLSPGLRFTSNAGRVRGFFDYALNGLVYAKTTTPNRVQNALSAALTAEAIENWAYVDLRSSITQQAISAFGVQSVNNGLNNVNQTEMANVSLSPYVRGNLAGVAHYEARVNLTETNTKGAPLGDSTSRGGQLSLGGLSSRSLLNWSLSGSVQKVDFKQGRNTEDDQLQGTLKIAARDDLQFSVNGGAETNNFLSVSRERHSTYGLGMNWTPTDRTKLSAQADHRFFGDAHHVSFEHRFARSIWRFSDSKDVSTNPGQGNAVNLGSNYELFYSMFASLVPDPVKRAIFVSNYLQANGINPTTVAVGGFVNSGVTLARRQELSFALTGVRDTITLLASRNETQPLGLLSNGQGDLSNSNLVLQHGISVSLSHRLTPTSTANLTLAQQKTAGSLSNQSSTLRSILANWSATLGARTTVSLGARYTDYSALLNSYKEKAIYSNLTRQF